MKLQGEEEREVAEFTALSRAAGEEQHESEAGMLQTRGREEISGENVNGQDTERRTREHRQLR